MRFTIRDFELHIDHETHRQGLITFHTEDGPDDGAAWTEVVRGPDDIDSEGTWVVLHGRNGHGEAQQVAFGPLNDERLAKIQALRALSAVALNATAPAYSWSVGLT
jgi:hypothetical protein